METPYTKEDKYNVILETIDAYKAPKAQNDFENEYNIHAPPLPRLPRSNYNFPDMSSCSYVKILSSMETFYT